MKMTCHRHTHTHNGILLSHKKIGILPFAATWGYLEDIALSEVSQTERDKYCMFSLYICNLKNKANEYNKQTHREKMTFTGGERDWRGNIVIED